VGMTLYNVERYLPLALDALLAQDYPSFEIVACDNASTDGTWDIVTAYAARDARIRAYRNDENVGLAGNYRRVVSLARGEFFRLHAHDDLVAPGMLRACVDALDAAGPAAVLAYPLTRIIDGDGRDVCPWRDQVAMPSRLPWRRVGRWARRSNLCNEHFGVIRTAALRRTHLFLDSSVSADFILMTELAMLGRLVEVPDELFFRRMHGTSTHQGEMSVAAIATLLEPQAAPRSLRRYAIARDTVRVLWDGQAGVATRASCVAAFLARYGVRQIGGRLRRYRERLLRIPRTPAPWEVGDGAA
jgi:glycosyltransferase involved in cell wall biosynthesis